jgi:hypothetical protein
MSEKAGTIMNTFWVKIVIFAVIVVGIVVLINVFPKPQQKAETESFYDVAAKDRKRLLAKPEKVEDIHKRKALQRQEQPAEQPKAAQPTPTAEKPTTLYFKELSEIDKVEAERLLGVAVPGRSIGRLPMTGFKLMVDNCRRIIQRWPDSWYAYRAKQMLTEMPQRFRKRYRVTEEEMDLSRFAEPGPGTKPFTIEKSD